MLDALHGGAAHRFHVDELGLLLAEEVRERIGHFQPPRLRAPLEHVAHHVLQVDADLFDGAARDDLERWHGRLANFDLDGAVVEAAVA